MVDTTAGDGSDNSRNLTNQGGAGSFDWFLVVTIVVVVVAWVLMGFLLFAMIRGWV